MKKHVFALLLALAASGASAAKLTILKAGPVGEVATLAEANEIRVVFSEPMIVVGKVPKALVVPWFHVAPAIKGAFRWSDTTTLIFTPDEKTPLPFATKYDVTIDDTAKSLAGSALDRSYTFSFITPTVRLLNTSWYRRAKKADGSVLISLTFNQPVDSGTIIQHLQLRTKSHSLEPPSIPDAGLERLKKLEPQAMAAFEAKRTRAEQTAASDSAAVLSFVATDWDKKLFPPRPETVVLETKPGIAPGTNIQVFIDSELAKTPTNVRTGRTQE